MLVIACNSISLRYCMVSSLNGTGIFSYTDLQWLAEVQKLMLLLQVRMLWDVFVNDLFCMKFVGWLNVRCFYYFKLFFSHLDIFF